MSNYFNLFAKDKVLRPEMGRWDKINKIPNSRDDIHLGSLGIRLLARCIKHCVLRRRGDVTQLFRNVDQGTQEAPVTNIYRQQHGAAQYNVSGAPFNGSYSTAVKELPINYVNHGYY